MQSYNGFVTFPSRDLPGHLYFITATVCGWKPLFARPEYAQIVLNSLAWLQQNGKCSLFAFVLMPSHLHAIVGPESEPIGSVLQAFGSFTAHKILERLRTERRSGWIQFFHEERRDERHARSIWQDIQAKNIYSMKFLQQKMEYIHSNPVRKEWKLVEDRADYAYSSACFYDSGKEPIIAIKDVRQWLMPEPAERPAAEDGG